MRVAGLALGAALVLTGCGTADTTGQQTPAPTPSRTAGTSTTATARVTYTATAGPSPTATRAPMPGDGRGIGSLRSSEEYWHRIGLALSARLSTAEPSHRYDVVCQPIPVMMWSAATRCDVRIDGGAAQEWTATVIGACDRPVVRLVQGRRAVPFPTPVPGADIPVVECPATAPTG